MADLTTQSALPDGAGLDAPSRSADRTTASVSSSPVETATLVNSYYTQWREDRKPYEIQWFLNAAFVRGQQQVKWNPTLNKLEQRRAPAHRVNRPINRILPKVRARLAKFVKNRPLPQVIPASTDRDAVMDAKITEKVLDYQWRRLSLETKYEDVIVLAMTTGKAFWWTRWDAQAAGRVKHPVTQEVLELPLGDVEVEVGTAFEMLVADPGISRLADQPMIMRIKVRTCRDVEQRYSLPTGSLQGDTSSGDIFQYQKQIASIGARMVTGLNEGQNTTDTALEHIVVKELFVRPCAAYPKGRYCVVAGAQTLKDESELPYDFGPQATNPYPCVEFSDMVAAGQFWPTTQVEQLIGVQREYTEVRNKITEQVKLTMHPKLIAPKQAGLARDAYNSEAGEKIEYHHIPGMPAPGFLQAPGVSTDSWRVTETIRQEFDDITGIYPSSVGAPGDNGQSGFQTNLLQEAADSLHAPDIRRNELAVEECAFKLRRFMKLGYDIPRLVSIVGRGHQPEVFEFSQDHIDEHAHVIVQAGSALPTLKAARAKMIMEMNGAMLFGDPRDAATRRRVLGMLEVGGIEDATDMLKRDEDQARLENLDVTKHLALEAPMPWENHQIHYEFHTDLLKSSEIRSWDPEQRDELVRHVILHARFINPQNALMLAQQFGYTDLVQQILPMVQPQAGPPGAAPPAPPAPPAGPGAPAAPGPMPASAPLAA